jgi:hypothetical protein
MESRKSASPSGLRKGDVYCVWSFVRSAEQWFEEEFSRQSKLEEHGTVSRRRQPSRAAKDKFKTSDYALSANSLDSIITPTRNLSTFDETSVQCLAEISIEQGLRRPDSAKRHFQTQLSRLIWTKSEELKSRRAQDTLQCICALSGKDLGCLGGNHCGHGLVNQCIRWVPRGRKEQIRCEMIDLFSSEAGDRFFRHLPNERKAKGNKLKDEMLRRLQRIRAADGQGAMPKAEMRESPSLGRWPATMEFWREDVTQQRVELLGLAFAVDICLGQTRILML